MAALIWYAPTPSIPKSAEPQQLPPAVVPPPNTKESSESTLNEPPTRPATAAEIEKCEKTQSSKLPADWPVERTWKIAHSVNLGQDICLAIHKIRLKNNKVETIEDSMVSDEYAAIDSNGIHTYFKKEGYFAVSGSFMENSYMRLISDKTGETFDMLCNVPVFSPQGQWVVSDCTSGDGESSPNEIGVWAVSENGLKKVYDSGETAATPQNVKWLDDNTIGFEMEVHTVDGEDNKLIPTQLQYRNGSWTMDPPAVPAQQISDEYSE
ncbi:MAG: hypothetical protein M3Q07_03515 [Pseudobdellovibrionaceae bacterium]|nr:hypothetical protein [Pseudobdellovibrionaceae bacterium]